QRVRALEQRMSRVRAVDEGPRPVYVLNERRPHVLAMTKRLGLGGLTDRRRPLLYGAVGLALALCVALVCVVLWLTVAAGKTFTAFSDGFERGNWAVWSTVQTKGDGSARVQSGIV